MYDLSRVIKEFTEICNKAGVQVTCPIELNGRLKKTLGQVRWSRRNGIVRNEKVEFSKQLLATATDKSIRDVIAHEACHYIATARSGENHGHDLYFKSICAEIGTSADGTHATIERTISNDQIYKYTVKCIDCDATLGYYHRMSKKLKNINNCRCGKCGSSNLAIVHNF